MGVADVADGACLPDPGTAVAGRPGPPSSSAGPHVWLAVTDPGRAAGWWCRTLGFEPEPAARPDVLVRHPDSGLSLGFRRPDADHPVAAPGRLALRVASRSALHDWADHLDELGVEHTPIRDRGIDASLTLAGPDGTGIELWWPRPT
jgi:glyoxylase I family protein